MNKSIENQISKIYTEVFKKVFTNQAVKDLTKNKRSTALRKIINLQSSEQYEKFAKKFSAELAKKGLREKRGIWRKYYQAAKAAHYIAIPKTFQEYEINVLAKATQHNFEMIKSIPNEIMNVLNKDYLTTLIEEVGKGSLPRGSFQKELMSHGHKNAKLIARTETAKLQTEISRTRAQSIGSVAYFWVSSKDQRTRPSHRAMNGVVVFWRPDNQKPLLDKMRGDAGEFPNCRCDADAIVDVEMDLKASSYKVYDYRSDKVVTMSKKELIAALEKGEL